MNSSAVAVSSGSVKADISSFLDKLDSYSPTIPVEVTAFHLSKSGVNAVDKRIPKLVSLAADKFLAEVIYEAKQTTLLKSKSGKLKNKRQIEMLNSTLTLEALCTSLKRKKISINPKRLKTGVLVSSSDMPTTNNEADTK
jgi:transcription initiation factor TFIID subunit 10